MTKRPLLLLLTALALLGANLGVALAQDAQEPPADAERLAAGDEAVLAHWVGPDAGTINTTIADAGTLWFAFQGLAPQSKPDAAPADDGNATAGENETAQANETAEPAATSAASYRAYVNLTTDDALQAQPQTLVLETTEEGAWTFDSIQLESTLAEQGDVPANYTFTADVHRVDNGTLTLLETLSGSGTVTIETGQAPIPVPPADPGIPAPYLIGGAAAVLVVGGGAAVLLQRRKEQERQAKMPRRSSVLREEALERAALKRPEQVAAVKQEIRQQEQVRERRRELQILDAKKADVQKTMDLLKKRREAGGLTEHQYNTMVAKKQADLQKIEAEIAEMEAEDAGRGGNGGSGGAAA